jgi:hypothetical protein
MRKILTITFILIINTLFAQLKPGTYSYKNTDATLTFTITEDGQIIKDCVIKGTNDISLVLLRQYKKSGAGEFIKNVDTLKPSPFTGYYSISGEMPTYEIKTKSNPDIISIVIGVKLKSTQFIRE